MRLFPLLGAGLSLLAATSARADHKHSVPIGYMAFGIAYGHGTVKSDTADVTNNGYGVSALHVKLPMISNFAGSFLGEDSDWLLTDFMEGAVHLGSYQPEEKRTTYSGTDQQIAEQAAGSSLWSSGHLAYGLQLHQENYGLRAAYMANYDRVRFPAGDDTAVGVFDTLAHVLFAEGEIASTKGNTFALAAGTHWLVRATARARLWKQSAAQLQVTHLTQSWGGTGGDARSLLFTLSWSYILDEL